MKSILALFVISPCLFAQTAAMPQTTLAQAIPNNIVNQIVLASVTNAKAPGLQTPPGGLDTPVGISPNTVLLTWPPPSEAMSIYQVGAPGLTNRVYVRRGMYSTYPKAQPQGLLIWTGPARYFANNNPSGACNQYATLVLPVITIPSGSVWNCTASRWTLGIQWAQDIGWWNTNTISWRST